MWQESFVPWDDYPKNLEWDEILNPLAVLDEFFNSDNVKGHRRDLKEWQKYIICEEVFSGGPRGPGSILFVHELNIKLLEAVFLLYVKKENYGYGSRKYTAIDIEAEKASWIYYPKNLSADECADPYLIFKMLFDTFSLHQYRLYLKDWLRYALYRSALEESILVYEVITVYQNLKKLYSAAWIIYQRNSVTPYLKDPNIEPDTLTADGIKSPVKETDKSFSIATEKATIDEYQTEQANEIVDDDDPLPKSASISNVAKAMPLNIKVDSTEQSLLTAIKDLILQHVPNTDAVIHIGTFRSPLIFFLVVVIGENEKLPEGDICSKIENLSVNLCQLHIIGHKLASIQTALQTDNRFWLNVIGNGQFLYQKSEIVWPDRKDLTTAYICGRVSFHWQRWGIQARTFLDGALFYLDKENYGLALFLFHQTLESSLKAIIQAVTGYRIQMHNLSRLVRFTLLFTGRIKLKLNLDAPQNQKIFTLLQKAYSESRYSNNYSPDPIAVKEINVMVMEIYLEAKQIYTDHYKRLEQQRIDDEAGNN